MAVPATPAGSRCPETGGGRLLSQLGVGNHSMRSAPPAQPTLKYLMVQPRVLCVSDHSSYSGMV